MDAHLLPTPDAVRLLHPIPDAIHVLGIGRSTLYDLIATGEIHVVKIGRRTLIAHDELERYVTRLTEREAAESVPQGKLA